LKEINTISSFEQVILIHLKAAYNLARYLCGNDDDASDLVQESCLKAFRFYDGFRGENGRAWLLTIVRNTFYSDLRQRKTKSADIVFDEEIHGMGSDETNPETLMLNDENVQIVKGMLEKLPLEYREIVILRELEGFSYKEIAGISNIPIGTVMSRLARARKFLQRGLINNKFDKD
jgi:RNA polymerase sigma factor (sigma-70 family)